MPISGDKAEPSKPRASTVAIPTSSVASAPAEIGKSIDSAPRPNSFFRKATFDFWFNVSVLLLFVASLLNLIFRWKERYNAHFGGVVKLRQFIGWLDEMTLLGNSLIHADRLKQIRHRYESIVDLLPPNSDGDYVRAKQRIAKHIETISHAKNAVRFPEAFDDQNLVLKLVLGSPATMELLRAAAAVSPKLWLGGGSVRTLAWNYLTGRAEAVHDYDVVYFDDQHLDVEHEKKIEAELRSKLPVAIKISVKNQARMHAVNGEPQRSSLEDAIANWPERATATALRLDCDGRLHVLAPYGYEDVLNLIVRPTPFHTKNPAAYLRRLAKKAWKEHWPELEIVEPGKTGSESLSRNDGVSDSSRTG